MEPTAGAGGSALDTAVAGPPPGPSLRGRAASGVRWGGFDQLSQMLIRLAAAVVLTRLLDPVAFGVISLAMVVISFAGVLAGLGFGEALVQREELEPRHVSTAFVVSSLTGVVLAGVVFVMAGPVADFFSQPRLRQVLMALSAVVVLRGVERTPNDLLVRALSFRPFYISSTVATAVGAVIGLTLAAAGAGVWALVGMALAESTAAAALGWFFAIRAGVWRPGRHMLHLELGALRDLLGFSVYVASQMALGYVLDNGDNFLIGRILGARALGYYSLAYRVVLAAVQRLAQVMNNAAFPVLARVQSDRERLQKGFLQATRYVAVTCMPIVIGVAASAHTLVPVVFGNRWRPASTSLELLALSGPALLVTLLSGSLYQAVGRPHLGLLRTAVGAALYLPAFVVGTRFGINGVAGGFTVASYLVVPLDLRLTARATGLRVGRLFVNVLPVLVATAVMAAATVGTGALLRGSGAGLRLGAMVTAGALTYGVAAVLLLRDTLVLALRDITGRTS